MTNSQWPDVFQGELLPDPEPILEPGVSTAGLTPDREVHDWDGATGLITSRIRCQVDGHPVWGAGVARTRDEATKLALASIAARVASPQHAG